MKRVHQQRMKAARRLRASRVAWKIVSLFSEEIEKLEKRNELLEAIAADQRDEIKRLRGVSA